MTGSVATPLVAHSAVTALLDLAHTDIARAHRIASPSQRFPLAWRGAMRAAAAVLAVRARPSGMCARDVWSVLECAAPEWREWAYYFSAVTRSRIRRSAGVAAVSPREADDLLRNAEDFLGRVETSLRQARPKALV